MEKNGRVCSRHKRFRRFSGRKGRALGFLLFARVKNGARAKSNVEGGEKTLFLFCPFPTSLVFLANR